MSNVRIVVNFECKIINNPVSFLSLPTFRRGKAYFLKHGTLHYLLHNTYCRLSPHWVKVLYFHFSWNHEENDVIKM